MKDMKEYLENLITEKGADLDAYLEIEGHFGLTYQMLVDYIVKAEQYHEKIRMTLVKIDFKNGDVFHYLKHLATGLWSYDSENNQLSCKNGSFNCSFEFTAFTLFMIAKRIQSAKLEPLPVIKVVKKTENLQLARYAFRKAS